MWRMTWQALYGRSYKGQPLRSHPPLPRAPGPAAASHWSARSARAPHWCARTARASHWSAWSARSARTPATASHWPTRASHAFHQGLTLVHFSAQLEPILTQIYTLNTP